MLDGRVGDDAVELQAVFVPLDGVDELRLSYSVLADQGHCLSQHDVLREGDLLDLQCLHERHWQCHSADGQQQRGPALGDHLEGFSGARVGKWSNHSRHHLLLLLSQALSRGDFKEGSHLQSAFFASLSLLLSLEVFFFFYFDGDLFFRKQI